MLTGRTPNRAGVYDWIPGSGANPSQYRQRYVVQMRSSEVTLPRLLKNVGYATCLSGKWHCNSVFNSPKQAQPGDHGFDHWFATQNNASPSHEDPVNFVRNGERVGALEGFSCQLVAGEAVGWLSRAHRVENRPLRPGVAEDWPAWPVHHESARHRA